MTSPDPGRPGRFRAITTARTIAAAAVTAVVLAGCAAAAPAAGPAGGAAANLTSTATAPATVVVDCLGHGVTKPASYVLTCADGGNSLQKLTWSSWGGSTAFAAGNNVINNCDPTCVGGKFISYPALVVLWGARVWPHHPGKSYFGEMTLIFTGKRPPGTGQTATFQLTATGP